MNRPVLIMWITGLMALMAFNANAQMNTDFEQWVDTTFYEEPEGYLTLNFQSFFAAGVPNVTQVQGQSGSAMRLETVEIGNDTVMGLATNSGSLKLFAGGAPYTDMPDSVEITARYDMVGNDSASVMMVFNASGIPQVNNFTFGGSDTNWQTYKLPVNVALPPDTLNVLFSSSNFLVTPVVGSWIEIDRVEFTGGNQQIANNEFENWREVGREDPSGWYSGNLLASVFGGSGATASVVQSTDASSGTYAAEINTVEIDLAGTRDTFGFLTNAPNFVFGGGSGWGVPYTQQPVKMTFDYKYEPQDNDSAIAWVRFGTDQGDSINGGVAMLAASSTYNEFELEFDWSGMDEPDSLFILFSASDEMGGSGSVGSKLTIDNIQLEHSTGVKTPVPGMGNGVALYPNPAGNLIHFSFSSDIQGDGVLRIFDMSGRVMEEAKVSGSDAKAVDISDFDAGPYMYELKVDESVYSGKFVKQ